MRITPSSELEARIQRLRTAMQREGTDAVMVLQNADLFYFTGSIQSGLLYIPVAGDPLYLVRRHHGRARMESGLLHVLPIDSFRDVPAAIARFGQSPPKTVGLEMDVIPVTLWERIRGIFPDARTTDASPLIREVRMIKSAYEIHILMDAAEQVDKVYRAARELIREGMSDLALSAELEKVARLNGHPGMVRMRSMNGELIFGHLFSGTDSAVPTYTDTPLGGMGVTPAFGQGASYRMIGRNEPVIVDFSGSVDGYLVDQTRLFVIGDLDDQLQHAFDAMRQIQSLMEERAPDRPTWGELYDDCLNRVQELGYGDNFMGPPGSRVSFIGHGIGIEIDEYPFIASGFYARRLEPGMAWAFEPKVVFPGKGAVGIENSYYLALDGTLKRLTRSPDDLVRIP